MKKGNKKEKFITEGFETTPTYGFAKAKLNLMDDFFIFMLKGTVITYFKKTPSDPILVFTSYDYDYIKGNEDGKWYYIPLEKFEEFFEKLVDPYFTVSEDTKPWDSRHFEFKVGEVYRFVNNKFVCTSNKEIKPYQPQPAWSQPFGEKVDTVNFFISLGGGECVQEWFIHIPDIEKYNTTKRFDL